jgi:hypothetical protein
VLQVGLPVLEPPEFPPMLMKTMFPFSVAMPC